VATQTFVIQVQMQGAQQAAQQLNQIGVSAKKAATEVSVVSKTMALFRNALVAASAIRVVQNIVAFADTVVNMDNRLRVATKSAEEFARAQQFISDLSRQTRTEVDANAVVYSRLLRSTEGLGFETKELEAAMEGLALSVKVGGATSMEARNSLIQFSQSLASGALRGDELRSVAEQLPALANAIGKEFGMAGGQLIAFAKANPGILETEKVMRGVIAAVPELRAQFATMQVSIGDGFIQLRNGFLEYLRTLNSSTGVFSLIGTSLALLGNNIATIANGALYLAFVIGTKLAYEAIGALIRQMGVLAVAAAANPWTALGVAIVALIGFVITLKDQFKPLGDLFEWAKEKLIAFAEAIDFTGGMISGFVKSLFGATQVTGQFYKATTPVPKNIEDMGNEAKEATDKLAKMNSTLATGPRIVSAYSGAAFNAAAANYEVADSSIAGSGGLRQITSAYSGAASAANTYASAANAAASAGGGYGGGGGGGGGGGPGGTAGGSYTSKVGLSRSEIESSQAAIQQALGAAVQLKASEAAYMYLADRRDIPGDTRNKAFGLAQQYAADIAAGREGASFAKTQLQFLGMQDVIKKVKRAAENVIEDQNRRGGSLGGGYGLDTSTLVGAFLKRDMYGGASFTGGGGFSGTPGFRTGGSFMVGGNGGPDSQNVSFRATPGEMVKISKKDPSETDKTINYNITAQVVVPDVKNPEDFNRNQAYVEAVMAQTMRRAVARN
jgi:tape measure domain-containing protein